jgi:hypothetical protein
MVPIQEKQIFPLNPHLELWFFTSPVIRRVQTGEISKKADLSDGLAEMYFLYVVFESI